jgi:Flp pilus assembly pilin Flp
MDRFMSKMKGLLVEEEGQDIIEYALLAAFIAIVAVAILVNIGPLIQDIYTQVQEALEDA